MPPKVIVRITKTVLKKTKHRVWNIIKGSIHIAIITVNMLR